MKYLKGLLLFTIMLLAAGAAGCTETVAQAEAGDVVKVHYTGTFANGTIFDASTDREPLEFTLGAGEMIPGFDEGVLGMEVGSTKIIQIPADQAYGHYREDLVLELDLSEDLVVGQQVGLTLPDGGVLIGRVVDVSTTGAIVDANHRLAGEDLTFSVQLIDIA